MPEDNPFGSIDHIRRVANEIGYPKPSDIGRLIGNVLNLPPPRGPIVRSMLGLNSEEKPYTSRETARHLGLTVSVVERIYRCEIRNLKACRDPDAHHEWALAIIADRCGWERGAAELEWAIAGIAEVDPEQHRIFCDLWGLNPGDQRRRTLREVGPKYGVSHTRIQHIENRCIAMLSLWNVDPKARVNVQVPRRVKRSVETSLGMENPIEALGLSWFHLETLRRYGFKTAADLYKARASKQLYHLKGLGRSGRKDVRRCLKAFLEFMRDTDGWKAVEETSERATS